MTWPDGDRYEGSFKNDNFHGHGSYEYADGSKFIGEFVDGKREGKGVETYPNGDHYEGSFKNDKRHGHATYI